MNTAIVPYGTYAPYVLIEQAKPVSLPTIAEYPLNGETVSIHTIIYQPRGYKARWLAQGKFENHDTPTIHIYGEHERLFKAAGLPVLERELNRSQAYIVDVVLEWSELYNGYRPVGVVAYDGTMHAIEKTEREQVAKADLRPDIEDTISAWPIRFASLARNWRPSDIVEGCEWFPPVRGELQPNMHKRPKFVYYNDTEGMKAVERIALKENLTTSASSKQETEQAA